MEKDLVLVDTNVFIDSFRGKEVAKNDLHKLKGIRVELTFAKRFENRKSLFYLKPFNSNDLQA